MYVSVSTISLSPNRPNRQFHGGRAIVEILLCSHKSMDQLGKVAKPARGQLNRENAYFPVPVRA